MNIDKEKYESIKIKDNKLKEVNKILKSEFIGLDKIIDEICNNIKSWYLFPDAQIRPTIINLWGMTGTGKTSLIKRLFELLKFGSLIKFDIGDWTEDDTTHQLKQKLSSQLRKAQKDENIPVFMFDEFQLGRTLSNMGDEIDRSGLRIIWELIDSGKFDIIEDNWETQSLMKLYTKLSHCIEDNGVTCKNSVITKNKNVFDTIFPKDDLLEDDEEEYIKDCIIPQGKLWLLRKSWDYKFFSDKHLSDYIKELDDEMSILKFVGDSLTEILKPVEHDFSNSIIFNIGNLDEIYIDSKNMDPDLDADTLYDITEKITLTDVKEALSSRFRPEQIGRLGNTHIIYKSFTSQNYKDLIELELRKINMIMKEKFDIEISFSDNVKTLLYSESVFPTQGARPIFSTIKNLIECYIGRIITDSIQSKYDPSKIIWDYKDKKFEIALYSDNLMGITTLYYDVDLKIENLRESINDDIQSLVAVHEAGHTVASIYALKLCPKHTLSKTANSSDGITYIEMPRYRSKQFLLNEIIVSLAGLCAEKMIFGEDNNIWFILRFNKIYRNCGYSYKKLWYG